MALNNTSKGIHASCMDYLTMEMVAYVIRTSSNLSDEAIQYKLEHLGFEVGQRLMELYTRDRKRFKDNLEAVKFICKEFWIELYQKQIDNLRTNHKGTFVLHENKFRWLRHMSAKSTDKEIQNYLLFPCGLIRGALTNLGLHNCVVTAEYPNFPGCIFTIKL